MGRWFVRPPFRRAGGRAAGVEVDGTRVCLAKVDGEVYAFATTARTAISRSPTAKWTPTSALVTCDWHGATFDIRTGAARSLPGHPADPVYEVRREGDDILVEVGEPPRLAAAPQMHRRSRRRRAPMAGGDFERFSVFFPGMDDSLDQPDLTVAPHRNPALPVDQLRREFPILEQEVNGHPLAYLDNAASTQKPRAVIDAVARLYREDYANVHRGIHELSRRSTEAYEAAREQIAGFFGIDDTGELILTSGTTMSLNLVAWTWGTANLRGATRSCCRPWSTTPTWCPGSCSPSARARGCASSSWTSRGATASRRHGALHLRAHPARRAVARLQRAGHREPGAGDRPDAGARGGASWWSTAHSRPRTCRSTCALGCDFFAFSGHKMYGPSGVGGLWGRRELLERCRPSSAAAT
jgi:nitrite reductase/ring-hydroxylating ferredoxin subunit